VTIAQTDREIKALINEHHTYGAETIINALARASKDEKFLGEDEVIVLVKSAFKRMREEESDT